MSNPESKRVLCGAFGIHRFILGDTKGGLIRLLLCFACGIGTIIGFVEGIIYLTKTDEQFISEYQEGGKAWF
jgi:TM2 domain-containing membrane protein YozV